MTDDTKPCPVCAETIKAAAIKCRFCGTDLVAYQVQKDAEVERTLFEGHPAVLTSAGQYLIAILTLGIGWIVYWIRSRMIRFELTTQRVRVERGLFSKQKDNVELFGIEHFDIHKPLGMRLVGHCQLHLHSADERTVSVLLYGIPDLEALADTLRECSLRERKRRGVTTWVDA
jgi:uncharacterized membrane protein YdbT with pleckstrin-like domain